MNKKYILFLLLFLTSCANMSKKDTKANFFEVKSRGISIIIEGRELAQSLEIYNINTKNRGNLKEIVCKVKNIGENPLGISYKYMWKNKTSMEGFNFGPWINVQVMPDRIKTLRAIGQTKSGYISTLYIK